jgi:hypothetical protein
MLNEDYKEMLQCLLEEKVRFLLVGAYAVAVYGYPRATKDLVANKRATGRTQDLADIERLIALPNRNNNRSRA